MDAAHRSDRRARDPKPLNASAANRLALAAARRMQLEQVRLAVRIQLAESHRRRQALSARRQPGPSARRLPAAPPPAAHVTRTPEGPGSRPTPSATERR